MGDRSFLGSVDPDRQGSTEPNRGRGKVRGRVALVNRSATSCCLDEPTHDIECCAALHRPIVVLEERVHNIHSTEPTIDRGVQILTQRIAAGIGLVECRATLADRAVQGFDSNGEQLFWLIGEVPVMLDGIAELRAAGLDVIED